MDASSDDFDPAQALAAVQSTRAGLADRVDARSWRYDLTYAALAGAMVAGQALPLPFNILASALGVVGLTVLARDWARRSGVWVSGVAPRRARWAAVGLGLGVALLSYGVLWAGREGQAWVAAPGGLLAAAAALAGSRLWRRLYRGDLAEGVDGDRRGGLTAPGLLLSALGVALLLGAGALYAGGQDSFWVGCLIGTGLVLLAAPGVLHLKAKARLAR